MEYCPHCMRPASGAFCESCGGQVHWQNPACQLPVGSLLRGSTGRVYQVGAAKGQGGFGITYAAMDLETWDRVAIKEYYPNYCASRDSMNKVLPTTGQADSYESGMRNFLEEGKMLSSVGALPSVVSVRDSFEANGTAYIVMEYVDGKPLYEVVKKKGRMSWQELKPLLLPLMRDLDILHRAGIIHRDISPDNLILTPQNTLKLLDFGSARSVQVEGMTVMLKAGFSPVEQYQTKGQGPYTDVYALAATLYFCLTGTVPPTSMARVTEDELKDPRDLGAVLNDGEARALLWGMAMKPTDRPQSMRDFSDALLRSQTPPISKTGGQGTDGGPTGTGRKKTMFAICGGVAAAVLIAAVSLLLILGGSRSAQGYQYKLKSGDALITRYSGSSATVSVPEQLDGHPVTAIRKNAFADCDTLKSVTLPSQVSSVEANAFRDCDRLEYVFFTDSGVTVQVDEEAFAGCRELLCLAAGSESRTVRWNGEVPVCYLGSELDQGTVESVTVSDGVAYAITSWDCAVALNQSSKLPTFLDDRRVFDADGKRTSVLSGVTDIGVEYEIYNGEAYIVGYQGFSDYFFMPDTIEGCDVTVICGGAMAGHANMHTVLLPQDLRVIQSGAFDGCTALERVNLYSAEEIANDAFRGCPLRCVFYSDVAEPAVTSANFGDDCMVYPICMETGAGMLIYTEVLADGTICGSTLDDQGVLLDVPAGVSHVELPEEICGSPMTWVYAHALDNADEGVEIVLAPDMCFPSELYAKATWDSPNIDDFAYSWIFTCMLCEEVNAARPNGPEIVPDRAAVEAAMIRAEELSVSDSFTRPNGGKWREVLEACEVEWKSALHQKNCIEMKDCEDITEPLEEIVDELVEACKDPGEEGDYTRLGSAMYYDSKTDRIYFAFLCIVVES